jgi:hypothetical protein
MGLLGLLSAESSEFFLPHGYVVFFITFLIKCQRLITAILSESEMDACKQ